MPKIETYSGSGGVTNMRSSSATDFADTTGLRELSKSLQGASESFLKIKQDEEKLAQARALAEGRQYWLIELERRQQAVDNGEMDYVGFTENFNKDYAMWADETASKYADPKTQEAMRINLLEVQNGFLPGVMGYEASKRASKIKENYFGVVNPVLEKIYASDDPKQIGNALVSAQQLKDVLPDNLKSQWSNDVDLAGLRHMMSVSKTKEDIMVAQDLGGQILNAEDVGSMLGISANELARIENQSIADAQNEIVALAKLAETGSLTPDSFGNARLLLTQLNPDSEEYQALSQKIIDINAINDRMAKVYNLSPKDVQGEIDNLVSRFQSESDANIKAQIQAEIMMLQDARTKVISAWTDDFASVAFSKNDAVQNYFDLYGAAVEANDAQLASRRFQDYVNAIDGYAKKVSWNGNVTYLPVTEVARIDADLTDALRKQNGEIAVSDKLQNYRQLYGAKFPSVMRQIVKANPALAGLYVASRQENTRAANDMVRAVSYMVNDPKRYNDLTDTEKTSLLSNSKITDIQQGFAVNSMMDEESWRRSAYDAAVKMYYKDNGGSDSKAKESAFNLVYGDVISYSNIIAPASKKPVMAKIVRGANALIKSEKDIELPIATGLLSAKNIQESPDDYIEWRTSPDGSGLLAVWETNTGNANQPVTRKDGMPIIYRWEDAEYFAPKIYLNNDKRRF